MKFKKKLQTLLFIAIISCTCTLVQGAPGDPGDDPDPAPTNAPIDGGLSLLIAAGVGYAAKKRYDKRKKEDANDSTSDKEV